MMEILFVSHKYPPAIGGMERQSFELIKGMNHFAKVHKIVYTGEESVLSFFLKLERRILQMLRLHPGIGLIHFNDALIGSVALYFHHRYPQVKKTVTVHGLDVVFPWSYYQQKILPMFGQFDRIIAVSNATKQAITAIGIPAGLVTVIPNGVDHRFAAPPDHTLDELKMRYPFLADHGTYFVLLGRPVKRKGFSWLLREVVPQLPEGSGIVMAGPLRTSKTAWRFWLSLCPSAWRRLVELFLGYPTDEAEIVRLLRQPSLTNKVCHLGKIPEGDLHALLHHASAFLMPNIPVGGDMEGFGLVCLEASGAGAPVFASALEGITDAVIHGKNGLYVPPADAEEWIKALSQLVQNPTLYQEMAIDFQRYTVQHFGWGQMCETYATCFRKLLDGDGSI